MDETTPPPTPPRRRPTPRARELPMPPAWLWLLLGMIFVVWGFWSLRPRGEAASAAGPSPLEALPPTYALSTLEPAPSGATPALRPALQPIEPTLVPGAPPTPLTEPDTGVVGQPALASVGDEGDTVPEAYSVVAGDTLSSIAGGFQITVEDLMAMNGLTDPNTLYVGQILSLPSRVTLEAPYQKILPDSEVVLGPAYLDFNVEAIIAAQGGFLASYSEEAEGETLTGAQIVERVAHRYSVGPRTLLALLEYSSGWVTQKEPEERAYPIRAPNPVRAGLFYQLSWAANRLNEGYYDKLLSRDFQLRFPDGTRAIYHAETNPGTAALQNLFAVRGSPDEWSTALAEDGFFASYVRLFGDPWTRAVPVIPEGLSQPQFGLPWKQGELWYFTGGPHGGWGDYSAWAALDFVPSDRTGCGPSEFPVRAIASGLVIRSENGEVVVDMDGDGFVGTGWTLFYMHVASGGRAPVGTQLRQGDPVGFPSCEGGLSDATHLHIARRYNGQWMAATGPVPFVLAGWEAQPAPRSYDGFLVQGDYRLEACACRRDDLNLIPTVRQP